MCVFQEHSLSRVYMRSIRWAQAAGPAGAVTQQHPAAAPSAPAPASNPSAVSNDGAVDPNLLQNLLSQLQAPQQQAQVCRHNACRACLSWHTFVPLIREQSQSLHQCAGLIHQAYASARTISSSRGFSAFLRRSAVAGRLTHVFYCPHIQAQPWQGVPSLLQTLQLSQLLNQPAQSQQAPNLALLLGQQLNSAGAMPPLSQPQSMVQNQQVGICHTSAHYCLRGKMCTGLTP